MLIKGYAILWGDKNKKDLDGEYLTEETDIKILPNAPITYHEREIGKIIDVVYDDIGIFVSAETDSEPVLELINKQLASMATASIHSGVSRTKSGQITQWPIREIILTTTPSDPRIFKIPITREIKK